MKRVWIVYCEEKNRLLKSKKERRASFKNVIEQVEAGDFLVVANTSKNHPNQECFLVLIEDYPFIAPFCQRADVIQLITLFPDRRFK
ncbi:hypothetical protein [Halobacteriovorax sp. JY17]|uniref:hypothetical protein n=1 Tax=Halobacteriovorax sp. JY17 TaxID=2014617 RepID=UPI000C362EEF|nr:hypothetical protein [Halobacteriovorax sp. JY17]PIK14722.1 MAG: hypothetical protein CES88_10310 [Halobacteriovorax sp. JY17]